MYPCDLRVAIARLAIGVVIFAFCSLVNIYFALSSLYSASLLSNPPPEAQPGTALSETHGYTRYFRQRLGTVEQVGILIIDDDACEPGRNAPGARIRRLAR